MATLPVQADSVTPSPELARILAAVERLVLKAFTFFSGIKVQRVSLLTYCVAGFMLDKDEVAAEVEMLAAERAAIQGEPTLRRAAEIVGRRLMTSRGIEGAFTVRIERTGAGPVYVGTWHSPDFHTTSRDDRMALEDLAEWARSMGLRASRCGYEVIAPVITPARPALAKTMPAHLAASRAA